MANERLREALNSAGLTQAQIATKLDVDPKTVERWLNHDRVPYPRHRKELAVLLGVEPRELWPDAAASHRPGPTDPDGVARVFPHRSLVPAELWVRWLVTANTAVDILAYAALFLPEQLPDLPQELQQLAETGSRVRLLFGDPDSEAVARRGSEEGIGEAIPHKIRNTLTHYRPILGTPGVEARLHDTTLYNSIYRFDNEMLVSLHMHGLPGAHSPALHLRHVRTGDMFDAYVDVFERVWETATPVPTPARNQ